MRYLLTGAQGYAGRFLCAELLRADSQATIVGIGRSSELSTTFTHTISWQGRKIAAPLTAALQVIDRTRYRYMRCDLADEVQLEDVVAQSAPDCVIHFAAALRDDAAEVLVDSNVGGTRALIGALSKSAYRPLLVLGSSGSIYGLPESLPLVEDQRCAPHEPYAMSKLAAELVAAVLTASAGIPLIVARIFNIAGPGQEERHVCGRFASQAAAIVRGDAPPTLEIGDLRPTRDFIDVRDVARAIVNLVRNGTPGKTYNVASGVETTIGDVLAHTLSAARLDGKVSIVERYARTADVSRAYADITKLRACGFVAAFPLERTIADLMTYYLVDTAKAAAEGVTSATSRSVTAIPSSQG